MNYGKIIYFDTANARGLSTVLFISGCTNHCEGCHNKETWDFNYGYPFTKKEEDNIITSLKNPHVKNLVISGGDPCHLKNIDTITTFLFKIRMEIPNINIIVYTGYTYEEIKDNSKYKNFFSLINYLIDGRYDKTKPTKGLDYRGSTNQRAFSFFNSECIDVSEEYFKGE
jgi:anaerobic ribonucleoside-triphosphate reductase activating protein